MLQAAHVGLDGIGLCDRNSVAGVVRAHLIKREQKLALKYHPGARLVFADGTPDILAYPRDRAAWGRLCRLLTCGNLRAEKGDCILLLDDLLEHIDGLELIVMERATRDVAGAAAGKWQSTPPDPATEARSAAEDCVDRQGETRLVAGSKKPSLLAVLRTPLPAACGSRRRCSIAATIARGLPERAERRAGRRAAHRRQRRALPSSRPAGIAGRAHLHPRAPDHRQGRPAACRQCRALSESRRTRWRACSAMRRTRSRRRCAARRDADLLARRIAIRISRRDARGLSPRRRRRSSILHGRAPPRAIPAASRTRSANDLEHELALIAELKYAPYFLTVHDIVRFARSREHPLPGPRLGGELGGVLLPRHHRGRSARMHDLLFERFISADRNEPPDIDVDFEHERREEVIQYIYRSYGRDRAGIAATVISYRGRSAIREVGKVFGLSEDTIGALSSSIWGMGGGAVRAAELERAGIDLNSPRMQKMRALGRRDPVLPAPSLPACRRLRHHPQPARRGRPDRERRDGGPHLRRMGQGRSRRARHPQGRRARARHADLHPQGVRARREALWREAATLATSSATKRRPSTACSSAPTRSACSRSRAARRCRCCRASSRRSSTISSSRSRSCGRGRSRATWCIPICAAGRASRAESSYPSEGDSKHVLGKTLGVPLFQEQAMKIAIVAGGFTPGEADKLRRAMATFKRTGTIGTFKTKMIEGMVARGYPREFAERCFSQIEGFGEYGFPESHAASFALLVYASAWLKCRYPDVFAAALLNAQPMGFYAPAQIVRDVREHGVEVRPVDVNHSDWDATLGARPALRPSACMRSTATWRTTSAPRMRCGSAFARSRDCRRTHGKVIVAKPRRRLCLRARSLAAHRASIPRHRAARRRRCLRLARPHPAAGAVGGEGARPRRRPGRRSAVVSRRGDSRNARAASSAAREPDGPLPPMPLGEEVVNDYRFLELSLRAHPACFLRADLARRGIIRNEELRAQPVRRARHRLRPRHHSPAAGLRQRRHLHDHRGRDRGRQHHRLAEDVRALSPDHPGRALCRRERGAAAGIRRHPRGRGEARRSHCAAGALDEDAPPIEALARADAVKRPHDEDIDSRARGRRNPPRIAAPASCRICWRAISTCRRAAPRTRPRAAAARDQAVIVRTKAMSIRRLEPVYGTTPSRPTLTRAASNVPSGFFVAATILMLAPGLSSSLLPTT